MNTLRHLGAAVLASALLLPLTNAAFAQPAEWVTVNGVSLRYQLTGDGPKTLVFLQESNKPLEIWDEGVKGLLTKDRTILTYDPRGVGMSQKIRRAHTMDENVEDVRQLLDALGIKEPVALVGVALGSSIALKFAEKYPDRVGAMIIASPSALLVPKEPRPRIDPAVDPEGARAARERAEKVLYPPELRYHADLYEKYKGLEGATDFDSEVLLETLINTTPFADVLPKIQAPTLVVATMKFLRKPAEVQELARLMPKGQYAELATGHHPMTQSPELAVPMFDSFLKTNGY